MSKSKIKDFEKLPSDVSKLRALLKDLKDSEMKLEANLCIREYPTLEQGISTLILALDDLKRAEEFTKIVRNPTKTLRTKIRGCKDQIKFYKDSIKVLETMDNVGVESKIDFYKDRIEFLTKEMEDTTLIRYRDAFSRAVVSLNYLKELYELWKRTFEEFNLKIDDLLPEVKEYRFREDYEFLTGDENAQEDMASTTS